MIYERPSRNGPCTFITRHLITEFHSITRFEIRWNYNELYTNERSERTDTIAHKNITATVTPNHSAVNETNKTKETADANVDKIFKNHNFSSTENVTDLKFNIVQHYATMKKHSREVCG